MILWIIIWVVLAIPVILIAITDPVNYVYKHPPNWHAPVLCICLFIIIFTCVIVFSERASCAEFLELYYQKAYLVEQIHQKASDIQSAERQIHGSITQVNTKLFYFQHRSEWFGILSPYQYALQKLTPLKLNFYDTIVDPYM